MPFVPGATAGRPLDGGRGAAHTPAVSQAPALGPDDVSEPVSRALDTLILVAAASFGLSVLAVLATVAALESQVDAIAHAALPGLMGAVVVVRGLYVLVRRPRARDDAWDRARAVSRVDARLAEILAFAVPIAWLVGCVGILVRHGSGLHGFAAVLGIWLPLAAALWIFATFAWVDACKERIASAVDESDRRYRQYWRDIGRSR